MKTFEERLWSRIKKGAPDECWEWQGHTVRGYGNIHRDNNHKHVYAHRAAYESIYGPIPEGMMACHKCDNRKCCNPSHIFIGTASDNQRDKIMKGRGNFEHHKRGESHVWAKLTNDQVVEIRNNYSGAYGEQTELAQKYGVTHCAIYRIVRRKNWHIT